MISDAQNHAFDYILTKSISRFARNTADCVESVRKLKAAGVNIYFMEQGLDTASEFSEMILTVLASIAEMKAESTRENILLKHRNMNALGTLVIPARYGYKRRGVDWIIVPYVINHLTHSVTINRGEHEQILIEDHHEAIVDRELFQRVQEKRQRRFMGAKFIQYPFGSLPKCPYCGEVLHRRRCLYRDLNGVWICDDENCGKFADLSKDLEQAAVNAYNASNQNVGEITQAEKWWVDQLVESFTIEGTSLTVHWKNGESNRVEIPIDKETPEYILEKESSFKIRHGIEV